MTDFIVSEAAGTEAGSSTASNAGSRVARLAATAMVRAMTVTRMRLRKKRRSPYLATKPFFEIYYEGTGYYTTQPLPLNAPRRPTSVQTLFLQAK